MKKAVAVVVLLAAGIGSYGYFGSRAGEFVPEVRTVTVTVGDVVDTVVATGALEAVTTVQVGSQVSGIIRDLYVDYNSIVRAGDVIMRLDPSLFQTQTEQARANLLRAEADVERLEVAADDARAQLARSVDLAARELISTTELEAAQVAVRAADAELKSAAAQVVQAQASLKQHEVNLEHTVIRAPIDGIVISRLVDVGQTVAASLQAPELFVIAADLTKMRVIANVDESDVGRIRPRQRVTFTVDAYPADEFAGEVSQIRLEPVVQQNVVTYATVIDAPNPDLKLKPGMTATITLEIARRENVRKVPNAALRFRPTPGTFAALNQDVPPGLRAGAGPGYSRRPSEAVPRPAEGPDAAARAATARAPGGARAGGFRERVRALPPEEREQFRRRRLARERAGAPAGAAAGRRAADAAAGAGLPAVERGATTIDALFGPLPETTSAGQVWVLEDGLLAPVAVGLGLSDGTATELLSQAAASGRGTPDGRLQAGTELVSYVSTPDSGAPQVGRSDSPLIPRFGRGRRR